MGYITPGRNSKNVIDYAAGKTYIFQFEPGYLTTSVTAGLTAQTTGSNVGSPSKFVDIGWTQGTKITKEVEEFSEIDDSGKVVVKRYTDKSVLVEGTFLDRTEYIRNLSTSGGSEFYAILIVGATLDKAGNKITELWFLPKCTFNRSFTYEIGGKARVGFSLDCFAVDNDYNLVVGVGSDTLLSNFPAPATSHTYTVKSGEFYATVDMPAT